MNLAFSMHCRVAYVQPCVPFSRCITASAIWLSLGWGCGIVMETLYGF